MNYIQIEIGGKLRGWKVNQMTLELWSKKTSGDAELSSSNYAAVFAGLVANCYVKGEEPDFTFENVCDWVDAIEGTETIEFIKKTFEESQVYINTLKRLENLLRSSKEPDKKKIVKRKKL